jgi:peptidyl-tRNA hydrolase, PTH1 family
VGLGNPGPEHARTRHNVGFMVARALIERWSLPAPRKRFRGLISEGAVRGEDPAAGRGGDGPARPVRRQVAVLCPQTYMNDAGRSVGPARGSFRLELSQVVVVHDEIDLPFGEVRTRVGGGLAGHNGLKSLVRELGSADFRRVRVGVGRPDSTDPEIVSAHVLGRFGESEGAVAQLVERARAAVAGVVFGDGEAR